MPNIDLSILNQRQTPAFYADVFANRPAAGFVGRIFVSTDTYAFYRDNGTGWDLIGGPGTGTVTGSGASGQIALWSGASTIVGDTGLTYDGTANSLTASKFIVTGGTSSQFLKGDGSLDSNTYNTGSGAASQVAFFSGTNSISGENNLWWDSTNNHFGINTNTPGTAADIHHNQSTVLQLNQTTATNDTRIAFQNSGTSLWRIGNFYNGGANDLGIFDVVGNIQPVTVKKTTGQVLIGTSTVGAGKLVVASASSDNGIQIVGASAPSLRIDSAESGPTKRAGLGISTATNNFIQGSADRDFCIFNGSTAAASPILFGIYDAGAVNVQEAARISSARNFLVGTTTDAGQKLQVSGTARITGITTFASTGGNGLRVYGGSGTNQWDIYLNSTNLRFSDNTGTGSFQVDNNAAFTSNVNIGNTYQNGKLNVAGNMYGRYGTDDKIAFYYDDTYIFGMTNPSANVRSLRIFGKAADGNSFIDFATGNDNLAGRISSSQNWLIGTTTDNGNKLNVNGDVNATSFITTRGFVNVAPVTNTTFFTPSTSGLYIARVYLAGNTTSVWDASIMFIYDVNDISVINQTSGVNVSTVVSGINIQVRQIGGTTYTFNYDIIRIR